MEGAPPGCVILAYIDGRPHPKTAQNALPVPFNKSQANFELPFKVTSVGDGQLHTFHGYLTHEVKSGPDAGTTTTLGVVVRTFFVKAATVCTYDGDCSLRGVCHRGYCVCYDGYVGLKCEGQSSSKASTDDALEGFKPGGGLALRTKALIAARTGDNAGLIQLVIDEAQTMLKRSNQDIKDEWKAVVETVNENNKQLLTRIKTMMAFWQAKKGTTQAVRAQDVSQFIQKAEAVGRAVTAVLGEWDSTSQQVKSKRAGTTARLATYRQDMAFNEAIFLAELDESRARSRFKRNQVSHRFCQFWLDAAAAPTLLLLLLRLLT